MATREIIELPAPLNRLSNDIYPHGTLERPILTCGVLCSARSFVLFHTRRRVADARPYEIDRLISGRIEEAARCLDLELIDHVVLGASGQWHWLSRYSDPLSPPRGRVEVPLSGSIGERTFPSRVDIAMVLDDTAYGENHPLMPHVVRWLIQQHPQTRAAWEMLTHRRRGEPTALSLAKLLCAAEGIDTSSVVQTARWLIMRAPRARAHMQTLEAMAHDLDVMWKSGWPRRVLREWPDGPPILYSQE